MKDQSLQVPGLTKNVEVLSGELLNVEVSLKVGLRASLFD